MITNSRSLLTTYCFILVTKIFGKHSKNLFQLLQECENLILELTFLPFLLFLREKQHINVDPKSRDLRVKEQRKLRNCYVTLVHIFLLLYEIPNAIYFIT